MELRGQALRDYGAAKSRGGGVKGWEAFDLELVWSIDRESNGVEDKGLVGRVE